MLCKHGKESRKRLQEKENVKEDIIEKTVGRSALE
jgi:hypothetical protein